MDITVYTCITAEKDTLIDTQNMEGARFVAFSDQKSQAWKIRPPCTAFPDPRRNARLQKIIPHKFLNSQYSIYIDGNIALCVPAQQLVEEFLQDKDIAVFRHPYRDCIYDEAKVCARHGLDSVRILKRQTADYKKAGYPKKAGLCECNFIIRRHTPSINELNEKWWAEYCQYSVRDQLSFPFVFPLKEVALIEGNIRSHPYFIYYKHTY